MTKELKNLIYFIVILAAFGTDLGLLTIAPFSFYKFIFNSLYNFVFNYTALFSFFFDAFLIVTILLVVLFILFAYYISELCSRLAIYHRLVDFPSPNGETRREKINKVFIINLKLSFCIVVTVIFLVNTIIGLKNIGIPRDVDYAYISSFIICPAYLLSLRLLANPVKIVSKIPFLNFLSRPNDGFEELKKFKERMVSFYFSFIATIFFSLLFIYIFYALTQRTSPNEIILGIINNFMPKFDLVILSLFVLVFLFILLATTTLGEYILDRYKVIIINELESKT
jgi:hypothetical protein